MSRSARTLAEAGDAVDQRFRALAGVGADEYYELNSDIESFRPLLIGLPVDAQETLDWLAEYSRRAIITAAEHPPDEVLFGALLTVFLTGAMIEAK